MKVFYPRPHGDKLQALLANRKLPEKERPRIEEALRRYDSWRTELENTDQADGDCIGRMVALLNDYKFFIDIELIFDSGDPFLYRQKGQLKLDNTVIEEFLPFLVSKALAGDLESKDLILGPVSCYSSLRFESDPLQATAGAGMTIRTKDHDFTVCRPLFLKASHDADFQHATSAASHLAYIAAECKTNLDKTMFQEAAATAFDVKTAVPGARYYLLCEWLDMTPISSSTTAIDEVILLRRSKRLGSNVRSNFSSFEGRRESREFLVSHLKENPFSVAAFERLLAHVRKVLRRGLESEQEILERGYF